MGNYLKKRSETDGPKCPKTISTLWTYQTYMKNMSTSPVLKSSTVEFDNYQNILPPNQYLQKACWPNIVISFGTGPPHIYKGFTKGKIQKICYGP